MGRLRQPVIAVRHGLAVPGDGRGCPGSVEDLLPRPVGAHEQAERPGRGRQPVTVQVLIAGRRGGGGQGQ